MNVPRDAAWQPPDQGNPLMYEVGPLTLDCGSCSLRGPRGEVTLSAQVYFIAERLMRRPGQVIPSTVLISAMYQDPDDEPETVDVVLRRRVQILRWSLAALSNERVRLRHERDMGYAVEVVR